MLSEVIFNRKLHSLLLFSRFNLKFVDYFRVVECSSGRFILEDVSAGRGENVQNSVLQIPKENVSDLFSFVFKGSILPDLALIGRALNHQHLLLLFQFRTLAG